MKKIFLIFLFTTLIVVVGGVVLVMTYEKQVIQSFTTAANGMLKTKIDGEIEGLTLLDKFPEVSISMKNVKIYGSLENHKEKLAELDQVHFTMSLLDLIRKKYNIKAIYLQDGFVNLYVDENGQNNYTFIESKKDSEQQEVSFDINKIIITNTQIIYENKKLNQNHRIYAHELDGAIVKSNSKTELSINSNLNVQVIELDNTKYLEDKNLVFTSNLLIDTEKGDVVLSDLNIKLNESGFLGNGNFNYKDDAYLIKIKADKTDFKTVVSLLPNSISNLFKQYQTKGAASFNLSVNKNKGDESAQVKANFGCKNVSLFEPNTKKNISDLNFTGNFTNGAYRNSTSSVLTLKNFKGKFDSNPFEGYLTYNNFNNPFIDAYVKGEFPVSFFTQFSDSSKIKNVSGSVLLDVKLNALQSDIEKNNQERINSSGEIILKKVNLENDNGFYKFKNLNGSFIFNKNDIAFSEFTGEINNSDFTLNGYLKGFFNYFLNKKGKLNLIAELQSNSIDFDNIIETSDDKGDTLQPLDNAYLKSIQFNINAIVKNVKWGKFNFKNTSGNIMHNDLVFKARTLKGEIAKGGFVLNGQLDTRDINDVDLSTTTTVDGIMIDSIFYFFNNFNEDFITYKNIKGSLHLEASTKMKFDKYLNLKPETLIADLDIMVRNGELNDFEPMQNMSKFIDSDELRNIKFAELHDKIHIENKKIEIPELTIKSSVSTIALRGTHTFDQKIYYKVKVPVKNLKPSKKKEAESAYEDGINGPIVHLIISGTTSDFEIKYDKKQTKEIVEEKVKEEIKTIKEIIKGDFQEEEEEQIGLDEEEFFEFDEDTTEF